MPRDVFRLAFRTSMSAGSDTGELMLYGEIVQNYSKWYKENYPEDKSASDFDKAIKDLKNKGVKNLKLRINSPGGIVTEAVAMRATLTGAGFDSIEIRIEGLCASAATLIASIPGAKVTITPGSEYMIHNPWTFAYGNANDMEKTVDHLRQLEATSRGFYAQKTGQEDDRIREWMDAETWFTAEDAVKYGFADALAEETNTDSLPAAACVSGAAMAAMKALYHYVPEDIAVEDETAPVDRTESAEGIDNTVSNGTPVAGVPSENKSTKEVHPTMELETLTLDQLREGNPALFTQVQQEAVAAERERMDEIDALTIPGYEDMAAQAKANGTSVLEFQKQIIVAMKQKGASFLQNRQQETNPAKEVAGGEPEDKKTDVEEIQDNAKAIAEFAKAYTATQADTMF